MTFFERYAKIAEQRGMDPCSQKAADLFGLTKATISVWGVKSTTPKGETVAVIADKLGVSADYLLGRTDDPTDFTKLPHEAIMNAPLIAISDQAAETRPKSEKTVPIRKISGSGTDQTFLMLYERLDPSDKLRLEGVIQGMLMQEKYTMTTLPNAAHTRTDIPVTSEMIKHDEDIMDSDDF